jgi:peptide/nickel transport system permease protein
MHPRYLLKRTGQVVLTFVATVTLTFVLYQMMPGGPAEAMRAMILAQSGQTGGVADLDQLNEMVQFYSNVNPERPLHVQYINYLDQLILHQDMGTSIFRGEPVWDLLMERAPWSMFIGVYALAMGYTVSLFMGTMMAYKERSRFDSASSLVIIFLNSVPYYIFAIVLVWFLAIENSYFPIEGRYGTTVDPGFTVEYMWSVVRHATLPAVSMGLLATGGALTMRGNAIRVLGEDYVRVAELRGLRSGRVAMQYVGRNSVLPLYTQFMIGIAGVISSTVVVEQIFGYNGMGTLLLQAVNLRDYPLLMGTLIVLTTITLLAIYVADLTYGYIDPRVASGETNE